MKGVHETTPTLPEHQEIWDVNTVLDFLKTLHPAEELNLKDLTLKLIMLLALTSAQRCQTLQALSLENMRLTDEQCIFYFTKLLKTSWARETPTSNNSEGIHTKCKDLPYECVKEILRKQNLEEKRKTSY